LLICVVLLTSLSGCLPKPKPPCPSCGEVEVELTRYTEAYFLALEDRALLRQQLKACQAK
jgi:hypothetical protein